MSGTLSPKCDPVIPPSSLFIFWPGRQPPMPEEVRLRLLDWGNPAPDDGDVQTPEGTIWSFWFDLSDRPMSYLIWSEPVIGEHLALLDSVRWRSTEQKERARSCRWVVGLEGAISLRRPTADYQFQLRLCDEISRDWAPVIYDASSFQFRTIEDVRHLISSKTPPRTASLFSIHKVRSNPSVGLSDEPVYWLHTHGLERAGVPDLEIFDVPERLLPAACELIEATADLWISFSTPEPETATAIGRGLEIAWRPWQAVAAERGPSAVGGWGYRHEEHGHVGYRAVLVAPKRDGWFAKRWQAPIELLERLTKPETTLFKTNQETERMAQLARERWGSFGILFAGHHPADWRFAVKLCYPAETAGSPEASGPRATANESAGSEHLWFEVRSIRPGRIEATLMSQPATAGSQWQVGATSWHPLDRLSDWRIFTPNGVFDPETADALLEENSLAMA